MSETHEQSPPARDVPADARPDDGASLASLPEGPASFWQLLAAHARAHATDHDDDLGVGDLLAVVNRLVDEAAFSFWLRDDGVYALDADGQPGEAPIWQPDDDAPWYGPARQAGWRGLSARRRVAATDVVHLVRGVRALQGETGPIVAFATWLWSGGAMAFEVALEDQLFETSALATWRPDALRSWVGKGRASAAEQAQQLGTPPPTAALHRLLAAFQQRVDEGALELSPAIAMALGGAADNAHYWADRERDVLRAHPNLRLRWRPEGLAAHWAIAIEAGPDLRVLSFLEHIADVGDDHDSETVAFLDRQELARRLGRTLPITPRLVSPLKALLGDGLTGPNPLARALLEGLCAQAGAAGDDGARRLGGLLGKLGPDAVLPNLEVRELPEDAAGALLVGLVQIDAPGNAVMDAAFRAPPASVATAMEQAPPHLRSRLEGRVRDLISKGDVAVIEPLVEALVRQGDVRAVKLLGEAMLATKGKGWHGRIVPRICQALLKAGMGASVLVPLVRDPEAEVTVRMLALRVLEADVELLADASKWRARELLEPPELQKRLKAARQVVKERR